MESKAQQKILIVEDDIALRDILADKLKMENFSVSTASNGEEGLQVAFKNKPNLILLDIIMPKMDGVTMLKKLRKDIWGKTVPVLLLTNDSNPEHMSETLKDNAVDYLIKVDWELTDVIKKIRDTLGTL